MKYLLSVLILSCLVIFCVPAWALKNPAAAYCTALGYEYRVKKTVDGDLGNCVFPGGVEVDAWKFLRGEVARDKSYCSGRGLRHKTVKDPAKCIRFMTESCMVCVLDDGREVEVTELLGLVLEETVCGDGVCGVPENYSSCPGDCTSGSSDGYCDRIKDGRCDPDCPDGQDQDCRPRLTR